MLTYNIVMILVILIGAYTKNVPLMAIAGVLSGFFGYSFIIISYILMGDFFEDHLRQKGISIVNLFWSLAMVLFCPMFYWCNEWYNILVLFILIPLIGLCVTSLFMIVESPKFLLCKKSQNPKPFPHYYRLHLTMARPKQKWRKSRTSSTV